ncbi:MAG: hypothetical protein GX900_07420 [Clostridiaceae bacterium]|nr:hypothetical protein [Clostridiaceae bacterium]
MLKNVNATSIRNAIELGCRTMGNVFNRDDRDIPFMQSLAWPDARFEYSEYHAESHIPGRHLNALLTAEAIVGIHADEEVIQKHAAAAFYSFGGPIPLPLNRISQNGEPVGEPVRFLDHNIREGMHALYALSRYRKDQRADELMHRAIAFISEHFIPEMEWDKAALERLGLIVVQSPLSPFISGTARAIGPLTKYFRATGYAPALSLAMELAEEALKSYPPSGEFDPDLMETTHAHSITSTMSSLAQLAETLNDQNLMNRVRMFYDVGLPKLRNELGWAAENTDPEVLPAKGEVNTSGDIVETALILGSFYDPYYFEDAERIIRGHILPSQLRDISFIRNPENPEGKDALREVAERHLGAFGFPAPYGHHPRGLECISFNMDIVGGAVASLCEAYALCASYKNGIHRVNMLFDCQTEYLRVESPYTHDALSVTVEQPGPLFVRIPSWVDRSELRIIGVTWYISGDWIFVPQPVVGVPVRIEFPLTVREITLHHSTHTLRARLMGDVVQAMENEGMGKTFFEDFSQGE